MKPYLFLDVDGVLNYRRMPYSQYDIEVATAEMAKNAFTNSFSDEYVTLSVHLHAPLDAWLAELAEVYELAWATTWEHLANKHIAPLLGLGQLAVVEFSGEPARPFEEAASWKWRSLVRFAGERPFAFVDDQADRIAYAHPLREGVTQGVLCTPYGLQRSDVDTLLAFARTLPA
jgi:hypothetical protein